MVGREIMGLAGGKSKLKLIDIDSSEARDSTRPQRSPTLGGDHPRGLAQEFAGDDASVESREASEIGSALREARERSGQSLDDASRNLRIRMAYLAALENGDFKSLPGMTYAVGYVRTYAQYLELDVENAIALFKAEARDLNGPRQLVFPSPAPEGKVPGGALMFVATFLAIFAYAGWYYVTDSGRAVAGYSLEVPEVLQAWLDEPSTGGSSDGFTKAAIAASPTAADEESRVPLVSVPLNETTVMTLTPAPEVVTPPAPVTEVPDTSSEGANGAMEATLAAASAVTRVIEPSPSANTAMPDRETAASTRTAAVPLPAPTSALVPGPASTTPASTTPESSPLAVASLPLGGGDVPGLVSSPSPTPAPLKVAPRTNPSPDTATAQEANTSQQASVGGPDTSIPSVPDVARSPSSARQTAASKPTRVVIKASAASWVQVRASDSTTIMTKVMRAGDVYEVPDREGLKLFTGNAGALTILVDGKPVRRIGGNGEVARNVDLEPDTLEKQVN
jgi:cytoskeleton protein RodZ